MGTTSLCPYKGQNETAGSVDLLSKACPELLRFKQIPSRVTQCLAFLLRKPLPFQSLLFSCKRESESQPGWIQCVPVCQVAVSLKSISALTSQGLPCGEFQVCYIHRPVLELPVSILSNCCRNQMLRPTVILTAFSCYNNRILGRFDKHF